jgi:hypothetical protein
MTTACDSQFLMIPGYSDVLGPFRVIAIVRVGVTDMPDGQREVVYEVRPDETIQGLYERVWKSLVHLEASSIVLKVVCGDQRSKQ